MPKVNKVTTNDATYEPLTDSEFKQKASAETFMPYQGEPQKTNVPEPVLSRSTITPGNNRETPIRSLIHGSTGTNISDLRNETTIRSYQDTLFHNLKEHIDESINKKIKQLSYAQATKNEVSKKPKNTNRCFTCKPRGKVKKHIIEKSSCENFVFHHDMNHRPIILVTPVKHLKSIDEFPPELLKEMFEAIRIFCNFWNIMDYTVSYNCGNWQLHEHFHVKIKITDKIANRMRGDHFKRVKLEDRYKSKK